MATIIPPVRITPEPLSSLAGESKALLALQSLPDDYRVYHRKTWYSFDGGVREGEADLLLLHPELGMLVLEVKGGRVAFDGRAGRWTSTGRDGTVHEIKDPFEQAQRNVKALAAKAAALTVEGQAMPEFVHGHGVVFPDCDWEPGMDPMRAAEAGDRRARPRRGRDGPGGGAVPRLGRGADGRAADEEMGEAARAAGARAALLACSRSARRWGGKRRRSPSSTRSRTSVSTSST